MTELSTVDLTCVTGAGPLDCAAASDEKVAAESRASATYAKPAMPFLGNRSAGNLLKSLRDWNADANTGSAERAANSACLIGSPRWNRTP